LTSALAAAGGDSPGLVLPGLDLAWNEPLQAVIRARVGEGLLGADGVVRRLQ
jgi:hypothetical protein